MIKQLIIGLACEGKTDERFLLSIIKRTFENVVFQYTTNIEILDVQTIKVPNKAFIEYAYDSALEGTKSFGILIFCLHTDSDSNSDSDAFKSKINPAIENINSKEGDICKTVVPIGLTGSAGGSKGGSSLLQLELNRVNNNAKTDKLI